MLILSAAAARTKRPIDIAFNIPGTMEHRPANRVPDALVRIRLRSAPHKHLKLFKSGSRRKLTNRAVAFVHCASQAYTCIVGRSLSPQVLLGTLQSTITEHLLAIIWSKHSGVNQIAADHDFFWRCGHWRPVVQGLVAIKDRSRSNLRLRDIFNAPRLASLVAWIDKAAPLKVSGAPAAHEDRVELVF